LPNAAAVFNIPLPILPATPNCGLEKESRLLEYFGAACPAILPVIGSGTAVAGGAGGGTGAGAGAGAGAEVAGGTPGCLAADAARFLVSAARCCAGVASDTDFLVLFVFIVTKSPYATYEFIGVLASNAINQSAFQLFCCISIIVFTDIPDQINGSSDDITSTTFH
jgi:hypothetical protein